MIKKLLILLFLSVTIISSAQCPPGSITFTNQSQVDYFLTQYPDCTQINGSIFVQTNANGGPISNFNGLQNITTITGSFIFSEHSPLLATLNGLENLTHIGGNLYIFDTSMSNISGISNLEYVGGDIELSVNHIADFSALNNLSHIGGDLILSNDDSYGVAVLPQLTVTDIGGNLEYYLAGPVGGDLSGLGSITHIGGDFILDNDLIPDLGGLENLESIDGYLEIRSCSVLASLDGLESLTSLGGLALVENYNLTDITSLATVESLELGLTIANSQNLASLAGLENLTSIDTKLNIQSNPLITSLDVLSDVVFGDLSAFTIKYNQVLESCNGLSICNYLFSGAEHDVQYNTGDCTNAEILMEACNITWRNTISGNIRYDFDGNGCVPTDLPYNNLKVTAESLDNTYSTFTDSEGNFTLYVPQGNYIVEAVPYLPYFTHEPAYQVASFSGVGEQLTLDYCAVAIQAADDVAIQILPYVPPRPGFDSWYRIKYTNQGSTIKSGTIHFTFDDAKMIFEEATETPSSASANELTWNYTDLQPLSTRIIVVRFNIFEPPVVAAGNHIVLSAEAQPIAGDVTPSNNIHAIDQLVVNSYDPNDKNAIEGDVILINELNDKLTYLIRFQNTGSASAVNIRVVDTLQSSLYLDSFELIDLSHPGRVQLTDNVAEFIFDDINLADSTTDEPNSHGHIIFRIRPSYSTQIGDYITNKAEIYFDYNEAITTEIDSVYVDADTDLDMVFNSIDNCPTTANTDQSDSDNDGLGDACDDDIEVNPPYFIGFDTAGLDPLWRTAGLAGTSSVVSVSPLNDVDGNGNSIRLYSSFNLYKPMLISPRLNNLSSSSTITFWIKQTASAFYPIQIGFMTDPTNPATFTILRTYFPPHNNMHLYTLDLSTYLQVMGKNLAISVRAREIFIDDFTYDGEALSLNELETTTFNLHPIPTENILNITGIAQIDKATIFDLNGRILKVITGESAGNVLQVNVSDLSDGMYFVKIQSENKTYTQKFLKR